MKKIYGWTAVGILSVGALGACSSDKKSPSTTKAPAVSTATGDSTAASSGASDSNSATVDKFCADAADLVAKGPTDSGYASGLQKLTAQGASLGAAVAADPTLQTKLTDCLKKLVPGG